MTEASLNTTAIAVFVKTPGLSPVKTRLAASIGSTAAEQFYKLCTEAIQETLQSLAESPEIDVFWAVGEEDGLCHRMWQGFETIYTGEGDLGARQHHVYQRLLSKYPQVILIGADSPQLSATHLNSAIEALQSHSFALGRAEDGGYYLFAGSAALGVDIWTNVTYSCADTASQLLSQLPSQAAMLETLTDVDTIDDLRRLESELKRLSPTGKSQKRLLDFILRKLI
jgi:rSAM/selenodomain-associated transferase 1